MVVILELGDQTKLNAMTLEVSKMSNGYYLIIWYLNGNKNYEMKVKNRVTLYVVLEDIKEQIIKAVENTKDKEKYKEEIENLNKIIEGLEKFLSL